MFSETLSEITELRHRAALHDTDITINLGMPSSLTLIKSHTHFASALDTY